MGETTERKPLKHLDELYPGYSFAEQTLNDQRVIVGTRQTITGQALFQELVVGPEEMLEGKAALIVDELNRKAEKSRWRKQGFLLGHYSPWEWQQLKKDEREAKELR